MELTVLGKYGPYPKAGGYAASGYLVKNGGDSLLLDMGSGTLSRLLSSVDLKNLGGIFISHLHYDHTSDLLPLRYALEETNTTLNIYTAFEESEWYKILFSHRNFNVINVFDGADVSLGSMKLSFKDMKHTVPDLAIKIRGDKTLCYTGDSVYNDNIPWCFEGTNCVLGDFSKPEGFKGPHMNVKIAKELKARYKDVRIIATHLSTDFDPTDAFKGTGIEVSEEFKTYNL